MNAASFHAEPRRTAEPQFFQWRAQAELSLTPVHVLVRDCPEVLAVLRAAGIDVRDHGAALLGDLTPSSSPLIDQVVQAISWRKIAATETPA